MIGTKKKIRTLAQLAAVHAGIRDSFPKDTRLIFRGAAAGHELKTSLERACEDLDGNLAQASAREESIEREFQRRYHHYVSDVPERSHGLEWLAAMQHYGAPTRLLDWTYSIYIAAYFAAESANRGKKDAVIWMMSGTWATAASNALFRKHHGTPLSAIRSRDDEKGFMGNLRDIRAKPVACVVPASPYRLNERLTIQKGTFMLAGDVTQSFVQNLRAMAGWDDGKNLAKYVVPKSLVTGFLEELYHMGITRAVLFPGLDGFAASLGTNLGSLPRVPLS
jgi:hypothetical protein